MPLKRFQLLGLSLFLLSLAIPATTGSGANSYSITGAVSDQQKKPLSGVMITAFDAVEDKTITVFTKAVGPSNCRGSRTATTSCEPACPASRMNSRTSLTSRAATHPSPFI
jgi:hypothetical protein